MPAAPTPACLFDLGDTLIEYEGLPLNWEAHYPDGLAALATTVSIELTADRVEAGCSVLRCFNTRLVPREHEVTFATILAEICQAWGNPPPPPARSSDAASAFFAVFRRRLRCFPDVPATLARLRAQGTRIGVFTDVPYGMPRELVLADLAETGLAPQIDVLLTSHDVGLRKPHPATLTALAAALGCEITAARHIGNERKDVQVARTVGCSAILLDRANAAPTWGQDRTLRSLADL